jgi:chaperonin GroEL
VRARHGRRDAVRLRLPLPYFINTGEKTVTELEYPYILLHEKKLFGLQPMLPLLRRWCRGKPLLIVAEDIEAMLVANLSWPL